MNLFIPLKFIFFKDWASLWQVAVTTFLAYAGVIIILRTSGKRTLSKMNAFDFVVTVALGSCLATIALSSDIALLDGLTVIILLVFFQFVITWLSSRYKWVKERVSSNPTLIFYNGEYIESAMKKERVTEEEVLQSLRKKGLDNLEKVDVIILEATGDISIIEKMSNLENPVYKNIENLRML